MINCRPLDARLEDIGDHRTEPGFWESLHLTQRSRGRSACGERVLGGHMTSTYSEVAAGNQPQVVLLVTQGDCQRACTCVLVRQGVSVSALCNAALECHVCHPSPQLSGTTDGPTTERERRRRAAPLHAWANFTLSCSAKPESTLPKRHEMKNKCYVYMSELLLCTYVTSAVRTFSASLDLQPKNSRQQMAADGWKVVCRIQMLVKLYFTGEFL